MLFLENQRRLGRRAKHGCVVAGPCFALYSDEAAWGRWDGLVRICSASAVGALGPQHLGGVFLVENFVAVAAFKCLLDHGGLLFRRGMRFGRAAVCASCPLHGKVRLLFLENAKGLVGDVGNAWCSKCRLCWRGLAVEMLRAWVRGNVAVPLAIWRAGRLWLRSGG